MGSNGLDVDALRQECRLRMPAYMVPGGIEPMAGPLPRNPNGKIDRKSLSTAWVGRTMTSEPSTVVPARLLRGLAASSQGRPWAAYDALKPIMWRRLVGPFKEFGLGAGFLYALDRVLRSISPRLGLYVYELMVQPITGKAMLPPNLAKNLTFTEITRGHPDVALMPAREDIKAQRFEQGAKCLGVLSQGDLDRLPVDVLRAL